MDCKLVSPEEGCTPVPWLVLTGHAQGVRSWGLTPHCTATPSIHSTLHSTVVSSLLVLACPLVTATFRDRRLTNFTNLHFTTLRTIRGSNRRCLHVKATAADIQHAMYICAVDCGLQLTCRSALHVLNNRATHALLGRLQLGLFELQRLVSITRLCKI